MCSRATAHLTTSFHDGHIQALYTKPPPLPDAHLQIMWEGHGRMISIAPYDSAL